MGGLVLARACGVPFISHSCLLLKVPEVGRFRLGVLVGFQPLRLSTNHCKLPARLALPLCSSAQSASPAAHQTAPTSTAFAPKISFCPACGSPTEHRIPKGEEKPRAICTSCGLVHYQNPKMVVGCLVTHKDKVLLCKRSIEPSYGLWTLPAGYMELGESAVEGAVRETWEEANAEVDVEAPFAQLDIPRIGQSYILFRAKLKTPSFSPGVESLECALFNIDEIPFDQIAFSSISVALRLYVEDYKRGKLKVHHGVIDKRYVL
ncbi:hypothetical protein GOP47_0003189 [Adiantum capillus-veneris]|uniref:Nudix hydrolase domain-containing protein n=1 Tax=Adiantum capillus-veneris TaxID=13818 RepID=A0A9D4VBI1_ADICA|nr:hypothetical protein GOP47_0003189 [Adiantum capillus-veneris]